MEYVVMRYEAICGFQDATLAAESVEAMEDREKKSSVRYGWVKIDGTGEVTRPQGCDALEEAAKGNSRLALGKKLTENEKKGLQSDGNEA